MKEDGLDLLNSLQDLVSSSVADRIAAAEALSEWFRAHSGDPLARAQGMQRARQFIERQARRYGQDIARIGLAALKASVELNQNYEQAFFEQVFDGVRGNGRSRSEAVRPPTSSARLELEVHPGNRVRQTFVVENRRRQPAQISFLVSDFGPDNGGAFFRPAVELSPNRFELSHDSERLVTLTIDADPQHFEVGKRITGSILIRGHADHELQLELNVVPPDRGSSEGNEKAPAKPDEGAASDPEPPSEESGNGARQ